MTGMPGPATAFSQATLEDASESVGVSAGVTSAVGDAEGAANVDTCQSYESPVPLCSHAPHPTAPSDGSAVTVPAFVSHSQLLLAPPATLKVTYSPLASILNVWTPPPMVAPRAAPSSVDAVT